jgi:hypothetical protein
LSASFFDAPDELRAATYIVRRIVLQIWQVSDSITISTNTHPIRTLTCAVPTSWSDAANGPLVRVNICGIVTNHIRNRKYFSNKKILKHNAKQRQTEPYLLQEVPCCYDEDFLGERSVVS